MAEMAGQGTLESRHTQSHIQPPAPIHGLKNKKLQAIGCGSSKGFNFPLQLTARKAWPCRGNQALKVRTGNYTGEPREEQALVPNKFI
jgi:hypothetical protein